MLGAPHLVSAAAADYDSPFEEWQRGNYGFVLVLPEALVTFEH